jgi:hypothetical protein
MGSGIEDSMKTYTPELDPTVLDRLRDYAALFTDQFPHARPALWSSVYLQDFIAIAGSSGPAIPGTGKKDRGKHSCGS